MTRNEGSTMRIHAIRAIALAAVGAASLACGGELDTEDRDTLAALTPEQIEALKERYPRLGEEPLPQPRDRSPGADPVPERVREALSGPVLERVRGEATFYADQFEGRRTASGIPFRQNQMVAAHPAYPFGTLLRVTNLRNDRSVNVRVVDRGPFGGAARARNTILDLSRRAAERLDYVAQGRTPIQVEVLEWGSGVAQVT